MSVQIRDYQESDREELKDMMTNLVDHLASVDLFRRYRTREHFDAEAYMKCILENVNSTRGKILIADMNGTIVGYLTATMGDSTKTDDALNKFPFIQGTINELYVKDEYRRMGISASLMKSIEEYLAAQGCEYLSIPCLATNNAARQTYTKNNYQEHYVDYMKKL